MRIALQLISWIALAATVGPSLAYCADSMGLDAAKTVMLLATFVWFVATPFWMGQPGAEATA